MSGEIETVAPGQAGSTESNEATAAAAAFDRARGNAPEPVDEVIEEIQPEPEPPAKFLGDLTADQVTELLGEIPKYRKQIDDVRGQNGKLNAAVQRLQQETPRGEAVTVTDEDLAEMKEKFGDDFSGVTKNALNKILGKLNTRGTGQAQTPEEYVSLARKAAEEVVSGERVKTHVELLHGLNPGWDKIIGFPDATGKEPDNEFRKWLATQPADYQVQIKNSNNAFEIGSSIKAFTEAKEASAKKLQQNKQRLANAIQPTGQTAARGVISEQSAADKAFKARRQR